jgi:hypothetical protein
MCKWNMRTRKTCVGCFWAIVDGKKKHLMSKIKINSHEQLLNVKNPSSF